MSPAITILGKTVWDLPPLILHPFNERIAPSTLLESSKAALMLSGLIPNEGAEPDDLKRRFLSGRYAAMEIRHQSFAGLLTKDPPEAVKEKLVRWGVVDYVSIFSRAIGMNAVFVSPPAFETLNEEFLRNYHRYPDFLYRCYMESEPYESLPSTNFRFILYASGEYSRMLESQWGGDAAG